MVNNVLMRNELFFFETRCDVDDKTILTQHELYPRHHGYAPVISSTQVQCPTGVIHTYVMDKLKQPPDPVRVFSLRLINDEI